MQATRVRIPIPEVALFVLATAVFRKRRKCVGPKAKWCRGLETCAGLSSSRLAHEVWCSIEAVNHTLLVQELHFYGFCGVHQEWCCVPIPNES